MKHTPGPWKVMDRSPPRICGPDDETVAIAPIQEEDGHIANAALIVAAPEMLALLLRVKTEIERCAKDTLWNGDHETLCDAIDRVVATARGEP